MRKPTTDPRIRNAEWLDLDSRTYGLSEPFELWEADSTGMVHVLWDARRRGWTLEENADEIAALVMRSRWLRAVEHFAAVGSQPC